jgi:DNA repair protein RadC
MRRTTRRGHAPSTFCSLPLQVRDSLRNVLEYLYADEQKDYESNDCRRGHVFESVQTLSQWATPPVEAETVFVREVTAKYSRAKRERVKVDSPQAVRTFALSVVRDNSREHLVALFLDGAHTVVGYSVVFTGTATSCPVHPREIFQHAILCGAVAVALAHNHPSGQLFPSTEDLKVTLALRRGGEFVGIEILDHVIFTDEGYYSLRDNGEL